MGRPFFLVIPVLTAVAVAVLTLSVGAPRAVESVRLWGGPTDGSARWTGWMEAWTDGEPRQSFEVRVLGITPSGGRAESRVLLDAEGQAELALDFGKAAPGPFVVRISRGEHVIAEGQLDLPQRLWRSRGSQRGGFYGVASRGVASVRVAPARGAFAVPFEGPLFIRVEHPALHPAARARVELASDGARVTPTSLVTGDDGVVKTMLSPNEHVVSLNAKVVLASGEVSELSTSVPVVPGAFDARRHGKVLQVASPVERSEAFVTLVTEQTRLFGARVPLAPATRGTATGELALPPDLPDKVWAVVESARGSSTRDRVGWPLFEPAGEPAFTLDVGDQLLFDGFPEAARRERLRQKKVGKVVIVLGILGAVFSALSVLVRARQERRRFAKELEAELGATDQERVMSGTSRGEVVAMSLILLGFMITAAITAWRLV